MAVLPNSARDMTPQWRTHSSRSAKALASSSLTAVLSASSSSTSPPPLPPPSAFMAAMATSTYPSGSRHILRPRKDVFKPRFPLDPFAGSSAAALGEPWFLKVDALLSATAQQRQSVIFVLGAPSLKEIGPLLQSRHLAKSLVILATHKPPDIPGIVFPTVRVLCLSAPLALEDAGAVRFVTVLEWAERVARTWRKHGGAGVMELSEELDIHSELKPPMFRFGTQSTPASPRSSSIYLSSEPSSPGSRPSSRIASRPPSVIGAFLPRKQNSLPPPDPLQRPFDALINFMPERVSDKALLKNSILVTTISRPFLKPNVYPGPAPTLRSRTTSSSSLRRLRPQSIFGAFSRSSSSVSVYMPPTPPYHSGESLPLSQGLPPAPGKALLIHLLPAPHPNAPPPARRKLVESIESFLLSFAFETSSGQPTLQPRTYSPASGPGFSLDALERARPYVMQVTTFAETVGSGSATDPTLMDCGELTVADVVLSGVLDADTPTVHAGPTITVTASLGIGAQPKLARKTSSKRAWIATGVDVIVMPASDEASSSTLVPTHQIRSETEPTLALSQSELSIGRKGKGKTTRSSSAPLLASEWCATAFGSKSPPQFPSVGVARDGKGSNSQESGSHPDSGPHSAAASPSSSSSSGPPTPPHSSSSGPPTPPHSSEDGSVGCISLDDNSLPHPMATHKTTPTDGREGADGKSTSGSGRSGRVKVKWKFWRRMSHAPAAVKA